MPALAPYKHLAKNVIKRGKSLYQGSVSYAQCCSCRALGERDGCICVCVLCVYIYTLSPHGDAGQKPDLITAARLLEMCSLALPVSPVYVA